MPRIKYVNATGQTIRARTIFSRTQDEESGPLFLLFIIIWLFVIFSPSSYFQLNPNSHIQDFFYSVKNIPGLEAFDFDGDFEFPNTTTFIFSKDTLDNIPFNHYFSHIFVENTTQISGENGQVVSKDNETLDNSTLHENAPVPVSSYHMTWFSKSPLSDHSAYPIFQQFVNESLINSTVADKMLSTLLEKNAFRSRYVLLYYFEIGLDIFNWPLRVISNIFDSIFGWISVLWSSEASTKQDDTIEAENTKDLFSFSHILYYIGMSIICASYIFLLFINRRTKALFLIIIAFCVFFGLSAMFFISKGLFFISTILELFIIFSTLLLYFNLMKALRNTPYPRPEALFSPDHRSFVFVPAWCFFSLTSHIFYFIHDNDPLYSNTPFALCLVLGLALILRDLRFIFSLFWQQFWFMIGLTFILTQALFWSHLFYISQNYQIPIQVEIDGNFSLSDFENVEFHHNVSNDDILELDQLAKDFLEVDPINPEFSIGNDSQIPEIPEISEISEDHPAITSTNITEKTPTTTLKRPAPLFEEIIFAGSVLTLLCNIYCMEMLVTIRGFGVAVPQFFYRWRNKKQLEVAAVIQARRQKDGIGENDDTSEPQYKIPDFPDLSEYNSNFSFVSLKVFPLSGFFFSIAIFARMVPIVDNMEQVPPILFFLSFISIPGFILCISGIGTILDKLSTNFLFPIALWDTSQYPENIDSNKFRRYTKLNVLLRPGLVIAWFLIFFYYSLLNYQAQMLIAFHVVFFSVYDLIGGILPYLSNSMKNSRQNTFFMNSIACILFQIYLYLGKDVELCARFSIFHNTATLHIFFGTCTLVFLLASFFSRGYHCKTTIVPIANNTPSVIHAYLKLSVSYSSIGFIHYFIFLLYVGFLTALSPHKIFFNLVSIVICANGFIRVKGIHKDMNPNDGSNNMWRLWREMRWQISTRIFVVASSTFLYSVIQLHIVSNLLFHVIVWSLALFLKSLPDILNYLSYVPHPIPAGTFTATNSGSGSSSSGASTSQASTSDVDKPPPHRDEQILEKRREKYPILSFIIDHSSIFINVVYLATLLFDAVFHPNYLFYTLISFSIYLLKINDPHLNILWTARLVSSGFEIMFFYFYYLVLMVFFHQFGNFFGKISRSPKIVIKRHVVLLSFASLPWLMPSMNLFQFIQIVCVGFLFSTYIAALETSSTVSVISLEMVGLSFLSFFSKYANVLYSTEGMSILDTEILVPRWLESFFLVLVLIFIWMIFMFTLYSPVFHYRSGINYNFKSLGHSAFMILVVVGSTTSFNNVYLDLTLEILVSALLFHFAEALREFRSEMLVALRINVGDGDNNQDQDPHLLHVVEHWKKAGPWGQIIFPFTLTLFVFVTLKQDDYYFLPYMAAGLLQYASGITVRSSRVVALAESLKWFVLRSLILLSTAVWLQSRTLLVIVVSRVLLMTFFLLKKRRSKLLPFFAIGIAIAIILFSGWWESSGEEIFSALSSNLNAKVANHSNVFLAKYETLSNYSNETLSIVINFIYQTLFSLLEFVLAGRNESTHNFVSNIGIKTDGNGNIAHNFSLFPGILWVYIFLVALNYRAQVNEPDEGKDKDKKISTSLL